MIPKFLLADNSQVEPDMIYVVHTENPRFILGGDIEDFEANREICWIDKAPESEDVINALIEEAEIFFENELDNQDNLFDEDDEE